MPLTIGDLEAVTREKILPGVIDIAISSNPLWNRMVSNNRTTIEGGDEIRRTLLYDRNNTQWHSGRDQLKTDHVDKRTQARYFWKLASHPINIAEDDLQNNNGEAAIASLLETEKQAAGEGFAEALGSGLFSSGGTPSDGISTAEQINGLGSYVGATGTYGDIDPADLGGNSDRWNPTRNTPADPNGELVKQDIQNILGDISRDFTDLRPDLAVLNMEVWNKIWGLLAPSEQLQGTEVNPGFSTFRWNGMVDFVVDQQAPGSGRGTADNSIYFLRERDIQITMHEEVRMDIGEFRKPIDQDVLIAFAKFKGEFTPRRRDFAGDLHNIDPAE